MTEELPEEYASQLADRAALLRVAADLRGLTATLDDPDARAILCDVAVLERVAASLGNRLLLPRGIRLVPSAER